MKKTTLLFLLILAAWGAFTLLPISWEGWQPATCLATTGCFCEAIHPGSQAQPANAWSSLAFVLPGLLVLMHLSEKKPLLLKHPKGSSSPSSPSSPFLRASVVKHFNSPFNAHPAYKLTFGIALIVIGLGSAFYHASLTFVGQFMDVMGMYLLISFAVLYGLARLTRLSARGMTLAYLASNLVLAASLIWLPEIRREVFGGLVGLTLAVEAWRIWKNRPNLQVRWLALAFASLGLAYAIWILDNNGWLCAPQSMFQGHALWHILGALAAWFLFRYYRGESLPQ
jgi:dihydroceramidase